MPSRTTFQALVFFTTFFAFSLYHMVRKTPTFTQSSLISEWTPTPGNSTNLVPSPVTHAALFEDAQSAEEFLGLLNALFLFVYAVAIILSGMAADRLDLRLFLTTGMTLSAFVMFMFGSVVEWTGQYSKVGYVVLEVLNAACQATGWPCVLSVMTSWFDHRSRGYVLGVWTSSPSVGSIVGGLVVSSVVGYGYEYAFLVTSSALLAAAAVVFLGLVTSPEEVGLDAVGCQGQDDMWDEASRDDGGHEGQDDVWDEASHDDGGHDDGFDPSSCREDKQLLGGSGFKSGAPSASYGSSGHTCTVQLSVETSTSELRFGDTDQRDSNVDCPSKTTQLSNAPTHKSCIPIKCVHTTAAEVTSAELMKIQTKDTFTDDDEDIGNGDTCPEQQACYRHQCSSDFARKSGSLEVKIVRNGSSVGQESKVQEVSLQQDDKTADIPATPKAIGFCDALLLPGVIPYSVCYVCLKLVVYVFFFWLPFYLTIARGWTEAEADRLSTWNDAGGIVGSTLFVLLISKLDKCALVIVVMLLASVPLLYGFGILGWGQDTTTSSLLLFWLGLLILGVNSPLSAAVSANLSQQSATRSVATLTGIVEGCGTIGAAVGQLILPYLFPVFGWDAVFTLLIVMLCCTMLFLLPVLLPEVKDLVRSWRKVAGN